MSAPVPPADAPLRLFVAVNLDPSVRSALADLLAPLRAGERAVAWVAEPNLHLTLRFLGDQPPERVSGLAAGLEAAAPEVPVHDLVLGGLGAFPGLGRPRVLWVGVQANVALAALYQKVDECCAHLGLGREARPFHPHVTIGRLRPGKIPAPGTLADGARLLDTQFTTPVKTLDLMSSRLGVGGARYERLVAAPLAAGGR